MFKQGSTLVTLEQESIQAQRDSTYAEISSANEALRNAGVQYSQSIVSPNSGGMLGGLPGMFSMFTDPMLKMSGQGILNLTNLPVEPRVIPIINKLKIDLNKQSSS